MIEPRTGLQRLEKSASPRKPRWWSRQDRAERAARALEQEAARADRLQQKLDAVVQASKALEAAAAGAPEKDGMLRITHAEGFPELFAKKIVK